LRIKVVLSLLGALAIGGLIAECARQSSTQQQPDAVIPVDLKCSSSGNCADSMGTDDLVPLQFAGTPEHAVQLLVATLAQFSQAQIVKKQPLALQAIFTTPMGFRDQVDFRIVPDKHHVEYRSKSLFGAFDFGKNRSRMKEFAKRFAQQSSS
jgi:uncharacterized protein (DUF1499 family)